jgi:hypothetical protein
MVDVAKLLQVGELIRVIREIKITADLIGLPDVDVYMETIDRCDLPALRKIIQKSGVSDVHVILESVNYAEDYTGDRYYDSNE